MLTTNATTRAQVLIEALPYIKAYYGKIVVVKYGGNAMTNDELKRKVMEDIVLLSLCGIKIVLVHGGGPEINSMLNRVGKEPKFIDGERCTDKETAEIVQMVLCGKTNKDLVNLLCDCGGNAVGLCGLDTKLLQATQKNQQLGYVGEIKKVNPLIIKTVLEEGGIPVIATVADSVDEEKTDAPYNVNADIAAARIAAKIKADNLILLTDIKGLLENKDDENTLIHTVNVADVPSLKERGIVSGGMIPKIDCCVQAVEKGVKKANIIDGRIPHSILIELLTDMGAGTMFVK